MSEANKKLVLRWFEEVWNQQSETTIDEIFSSEGKAHGFPDPGSTLQGPEDFKAIQRNFCGAFPDLHLTVEDVIAEGDRVAARWSVTMTHLGDHLGIPATGKRAGFAGSVFVVVKDGKIVEAWNQMEILHLFEQLKTTPGQKA